MTTIRWMGGPDDGKIKNVDDTAKLPGVLELVDGSVYVLQEAGGEWSYEWRERPTGVADG